MPAYLRLNFTLSGLDCQSGGNSISVSQDSSQGMSLETQATNQGLEPMTTDQSQAWKLGQHSSLRTDTRCWCKSENNEGNGNLNLSVSGLHFYKN